MVIFTQLGLYSVAATQATDWLRNFAAGLGLKPPKWVWNAASFGFAIGLAFLANLHVVPVGSGSSANLASGLALGGGAKIGHELLDLASSLAKRARKV